MYILPQVQVFQEFAIVPAAVATPLAAHISGGHAQLCRYAQTTERNNGELGFYNPALAVDFAWPGLLGGSTVDQSYTKLWIQDALLEYFDSSTVDGGDTITATANYNNRVSSSSINFAANGTFERNAVFLDRDVKVGDIVEARGIGSDSTPITLWTYVLGILGAPVAATLGASFGDDSNAQTQAAHSTLQQTQGPFNCVNAVVNAAEYDGLTSGFINETYEIIVTNSSIDGDFATATLAVVSGSGTDNVGSVTPSPAESLTAIGTRGLFVTFSDVASDACSDSASDASVSPIDLVVGQRWLITLNQAFTLPTSTSSGFYNGDDDTTYIITVIRGGSTDATDFPQVMVTTNDGSDASGPVTIAAANTAYPVGTQGVSIKFSTVELRQGDRYYIEVTAAGSGALSTIVLGHNLDPSIPDGSQINLTLYILNPLLQVSQDRTGFAPLTNWTQTEDEFTVNSGIIAYDPTWTSNGVQQPLPVSSAEEPGYGMMFLETRYWLCDLGTAVNSISDAGALATAISGALDPDNPLMWGVYYALQNSNGSPVFYTAVCNPDDVNSWVACLSLLIGNDQVYGLVPLTYNQTVLELYQAHVDDMSNKYSGLWRVLWVNLQDIPETPIVSAGSTVPGFLDATTSDGLVAMATIQQDPNVAGISYTQVVFTGDNVELLHLGVMSGDILRCLFTTDGFGNQEYTEFVVDQVESENQLTIDVGPDFPINIPAKVEIWRNLLPDAEATAIGVVAGSWSDRRVRATWPDSIEAGGTSMPGLYLNCALAGLASGVLPNQSLTHVAIAGFTSTQRTTSKFNITQLNEMASGGAWIVTQDLVGNITSLGEIYTRDGLTCGDQADLNQAKEMVVRNVDSISYQFYALYAPFIGVANVTPVIQSQLTLLTNNKLTQLQTIISSTSGGQIISGTLNSLVPSLSAPDQYIVSITLDVPQAVDVITVNLSI